MVRFCAPFFSMKIVQKVLHTWQRNSVNVNIQLGTILRCIICLPLFTCFFGPYIFSAETYENLLFRLT
jgi:hypothetical protein